MAKKTGVKGLGKDKTRISDVYKENYDVGSESKGIFHFGHGNEGDADNSKCNVNMEQVKEMREMIGVSWISINVRGTGESGKKKGWIRSIIRGEQPDVIGLQETKSGLIDDFWIQDIWGGRGYGYSQAVGNSEGIIVIWDSRVFTCKEAIGDERFIAVRGSWKGKDEEVFLMCIYGPHDIWGGRGYGYSQLSVVENSGGIIVIWDSRVFTCKEAIGDERFITVRGSWKGQTRRCSLCVFMDHM
ncbi:hypothetical protein CTI12_AA048000 [Artemisia annua]|uniref:RNA-directed DNA polymerase, eukaryota, Reverse transcriptase zinc-binding domain protein n=1 Tax=Artemisia annua TaxID=35608 RepID=A0A2U1QCG1_ARTAN|nr:hypothetical protein CTI12_AA048000 [Artemisia annua]